MTLERFPLSREFGLPVEGRTVSGRHLHRDNGSSDESEIFKPEGNNASLDMGLITALVWKPDLSNNGKDFLFFNLQIPET